mmetsp:Transcript_56802/g.68343  ORF Transcript_56802/g.68343 Transcript_56802/m.68343 type:complete len:101 (+) Transcript_56802:122-424(+)
MENRIRFYPHQEAMNEAGERAESNACFTAALAIQWTRYWEDIPKRVSFPPPQIVGHVPCHSRTRTPHAASTKLRAIQPNGSEFRGVCGGEEDEEWIGVSS